MVRKLGFWISVICFLLPWVATGQSVENVRTTFDGEKIVITYDLIYSDPAQKFKVTFYGSHDNYQRPLSLLSGDFGDDVLPGKNNKVTWDAKNSLSGDFDKEIAIQVKATKVAPPVAAVKLSMKPFDQSVYKKGRTIVVRWVGGNPDDKLNIELFKNDQVNHRIAEKVDNTGRYEWAMPSSVHAGKEYLIRIYNSNQPTELSNSQLFNIKPRTPLIVKVLPVLGVGAAIFLLKGSSTTSKDLPTPPAPN